MLATTVASKLTTSNFNGLIKLLEVLPNRISDDLDLPVKNDPLFQDSGKLTMENLIS